MKEKLTQAQREFIAFLRGINETEVRVSIQDSNPSDWYVDYPSYHSAYMTELSLGSELSIDEKELVEEMRNISYGEIVLSKRNGILKAQFATKHFKAGQDNHDEKVRPKTKSKK